METQETQKITMSAEAKRKQNEYLRNWRRMNPAKARKHKVDYWERKAKATTQTV